MSDNLTDELTSLIKALHDSEINGEISWFYDGVARQTWRSVERLCGRERRALFAERGRALVVW